MWEELQETCIRLLAALLAGACVGWEREWRDKSAGLRTHMLVALGAALFMICATEFAEAVGEENRGNHLQIDPLRVLQGIVGGVGFLGAGAILQSRGQVRGLTTAASIWAAAAIGVACGMDFYLIAATAVVLVLVTLSIFGRLAVRIFPESSESAGEADSPPAIGDGMADNGSRPDSGWTPPSN